jgi:hypothetical protein
MALMDIFNGFRAQPQQQPAAPKVDPSGANPTVPGTATPKATGTVAAIPAAGEGDKSPLEGFKDLWQKDDKNDAQRPNLVPKLTVDPAKLTEAAKRLDFTKLVDPAALAKAATGDATALGQVINEGAQAAFAQAAEASTKILEAALQSQAKNFEEKVMPDILRRHNISTGIRADNSALFDDPAAAPMLTMVENQFATKYPNASPAEITAKAKEYLEGFATSIVSGSGKQIVDTKTVGTGTGRQGVRREEDWGKFFDTP